MKEILFQRKKIKWTVKGYPNFFFIEDIKTFLYVISSQTWLKNLIRFFCIIVVYYTGGLYDRDHGPSLSSITVR